MKNLKSLTRLFSLGMAALSISTLAIAQPTYVEIGDTAQLIAKGAGVVVPVEITCTDGTSYASLAMRVIQRVGSSITSGSTYADIQDCSSTSQTVQLLVAPDGSARAFRKGSAVGQAFLYACDEYNCSELRDQEEIVVK